MFSSSDIDECAISDRLCFSLYCLSHESSSNQQFISYMYMFTVLLLLLQISTSVHLTHVLMVGHVLMVVDPIHVAALLVTKAISVRFVRLYFSLYCLKILLQIFIFHLNKAHYPPKMYKNAITHIGTI